MRSLLLEMNDVMLLEKQIENLEERGKMQVFLDINQLGGQTRNLHSPYNNGADQGDNSNAIPGVGALKQQHTSIEMGLDAMATQMISIKDKMQEQSGGDVARINSKMRKKTHSLSSEDDSQKKDDVDSWAELGNNSGAKSRVAKAKKQRTDDTSRKNATKTHDQATAHKVSALDFDMPPKPKANSASQSKSNTSSWSEDCSSLD